MNVNKHTRKTSVSNARTAAEIGEFWDTHSLDDFWEDTREVEFEVSRKLRRRVFIDPKIYDELQTEAKLRGLGTEALVNLWLAEKLHT